MPAFEKLGGDIRKFEWVGGQSLAGQVAMADALIFHERLGNERKAARFQYPETAVGRPARPPPARSTPHGPEPHAFVRGRLVLCRGSRARRVRGGFLKRHRVSVAAFGKDVYEGPPGIRVLPNVFTSSKEVDLFAGAVEAALRTGPA